MCWVYVNTTYLFYYCTVICHHICLRPHFLHVRFYALFCFACDISKSYKKVWLRSYMYSSFAISRLCFATQLTRFHRDNQPHWHCFYFGSSGENRTAFSWHAICSLIGLLCVLTLILHFTQCTTSMYIRAVIFFLCFIFSLPWLLPEITCMCHAIFHLQIPTITSNCRCYLWSTLPVLNFWFDDRVLR